MGLQEAGIIDAEPQRSPTCRATSPTRTAWRPSRPLLGRDIPDDIGTVTLVQSDRLGTVQSAVRAFDVVTVVLVVIAVICVLLALWLSHRRLRMVLWLAIGAIVALLLGRGVTRLVMEEVTGSVRDGPGGLTVLATVDSAVDSLMWFSFLLIVVALIVAGAALLIERRAELSGAATASLAEAGGWREWLRTRSRADRLRGHGHRGLCGSLERRRAGHHAARRGHASGSSSSRSACWVDAGQVRPSRGPGRQRPSRGPGRQTSARIQRVHRDVLGPETTTPAGRYVRADDAGDRPGRGRAHL